MACELFLNKGIKNKQNGKANGKWKKGNTSQRWLIFVTQKAFLYKVIQQIPVP